MYSLGLQRKNKKKGDGFRYMFIHVSNFVHNAVFVNRVNESRSELVGSQI